MSTVVKIQQLKQIAIAYLASDKSDVDEEQKDVGSLRTMESSVVTTNVGGAVPLEAEEQIKEYWITGSEQKIKVGWCELNQATS